MKTKSYDSMQFYVKLTRIILPIYAELKLFTKGTYPKGQKDMRLTYVERMGLVVFIYLF